MNKSFLQTQEWLDFQNYVGRKTWRFDDGKIRANIIMHDLPLGKNYLYIPHGPVILFDDIKGGLKNELASFTNYIKDLGKKNKSIFIKVEPLSDLVMELMYRRGFRRTVKRIQPNKTVVIDLKSSEEELLSKMHPKTRYNIKIAEKNNIKIKQNHDVEEFWKLLKKTTKRDRFSSHPEGYYKKLIEFLGERGDIKTDILIAYHEEKAVAGGIVLRCGDTGYYLHGASDYEHRAMMAPHALHWEIIKYLKNDGRAHYDLYGIDAIKWPGVTRFKLSWGGQTVEYPGSFDLPVSMLWYFAYNLARKIL